MFTEILPGSGLHPVLRAKQLALPSGRLQSTGDITGQCWRRQWGREKAISSTTKFGLTCYTAVMGICSGCHVTSQPKISGFRLQCHWSSRVLWAPGAQPGGQGLLRSEVAGAGAAWRLPARCPRQRPHMPGVDFGLGLGAQLSMRAGRMATPYSGPSHRIDVARGNIPRVNIPRGS